MEYKKDFDTWNIKKKEINQQDKPIFFNECDVWWCSLGVNIDIEIDGKNNLFERPVLILKKINLQSVWVIPLTSTFKDSVYMYPLTTIPYSVSISQIRNISSKRLLRKSCKISIKEYSHIVIRLKYLLTSSIIDTKNETPPF